MLLNQHTHFSNVCISLSFAEISNENAQSSERYELCALLSQGALSGIYCRALQSSGRSGESSPPNNMYELLGNVYYV